MVKTKITLDKIVEVGGRCYGPGTIEVDAKVAETLINRYGAADGSGAAKVADNLESQPVSQLTTSQLRKVLADREAKEKAGKQQPKKVQEAGAELTDATLLQVMDMEAPAIILQLQDRAIDHDGVTEKVQLATLLADALNAETAETKKNLEAAQESQTAKPSNGQLPAGFPSRAKLMAAGLTTLKKLKAAAADAWPKELTRTERDTINAELALAGED